MSNNDRAYLVDMLFSAEKIAQFAEGHTEDSFRRDVMTQDAVLRRIGIIAEAAGRLSDGLRRKYKKVPWGKLRGMRNIVIHEYDQVDMGIVWSVADVYVHELATALRKILEEQ